MRRHEHVRAGHRLRHLGLGRAGDDRPRSVRCAHRRGDLAPDDRVVDDRGERAHRSGILRSRIGDQAAEDEHEDQVDDGDRRVDLERPEVREHDVLSRAHDLLDAEDGHQRGVLEHADPHVAERRDRDPDRLREHDRLQRLAAREAERQGGLALTDRHGLEPGPEDLGEIGAVEQADADHACLEGAEAQARDDRDAVVEPDQQHQQRDRAEEVDEADREPLQRPRLLHAQDRDQQADDQRDDLGDDRDLERDAQRPEQDARLSQTTDQSNV